MNFTRKMFHFIEEITDYVFQHLSAIFITDMVLSIGMLNPFVVERFQSIYRYPVTKTAAVVWDCVFIAMIIVAWNVDKWFKKLKESDK